MSDLAKQTLKLTLDVAKRYGGLAAASGSESLKFARNSALRVEVSVLENGAKETLTLLQDATLQVNQTTAANGTAAVVKVGTIDKSNGVLVFECAASDLGDGVGSPFGTRDMTGQLESHWCVIWGHIGAGLEVVVLGTGLLQSFSAGIAAAGGAPPTGGTIPSLEQIVALLGNYVPFNVPTGKVIRFELDGGNALQVGATRDVDGNPVKVMDWENPIP